MSAAESERKRLPLQGVLVVEFGQAISGPYAAELLADLGARVIKVEKPGGDDSRSMPPYSLEGTSLYFMGPNRSKESIVIDLKGPEGLALGLDLAAKADIVVENNRPGVMDRLGLGFEHLRARKPAIVLASVSGFGQDGPYRDLPAYDPIVQAMGGIMSLTGEPGRKPVRAGAPIGDLCAGMVAAMGAVAALTDARVTGQGRHVDVSMLDVQVSIMSYHMIYYLFSGIVPQRQGQNHSGVPEVGEFKCADDISIMVSPMGEKMFAQLCVALERPDLANDLTLAKRTDRVKRAADVRAQLEQVYVTRPAQEWVERLRAVEIPVTTINSVDMVARDPQVRHRQMLADLVYAGKPVTLIGPPVQFDGEKAQPTAPPSLGAHTHAILASDLALTAAAIDDLKQRKIVYAP